MKKAYIVEPLIADYNKRSVFTDLESAKKYADLIVMTYEHFNSKLEHKVKEKKLGSGKCLYYKCWYPNKKADSFYLVSISELPFND